MRAVCLLAWVLFICGAVLKCQDNKPPSVHMIHPLSDVSQLDSSGMISIVLYELSIYLLPVRITNKLKLFLIFDFFAPARKRGGIEEIVNCEDDSKKSLYADFGMNHRNTNN